MSKDEIHIQREVSGKQSKAKLYGELIVGSTKIGRILFYDIVQLVATYTPGALGLALRGWLFPKLLGSCGKGVTFGRNITLRHPHKIHLGDKVVLDDNTMLDAKGTDNDGIRLGDGVFLGRNSILSCKNGDITLGNRVNIGFNSEVFSGSSVRLDDEVLLAAYVYVVGGGHKFDDPTLSVLDQGHTSEGISIGKGVWLGAGVKVMDGTTIGEHTVVGAGAVVTKNLEKQVIAKGIPATVQKSRLEIHKS